MIQEGLIQAGASLATAITIPRILFHTNEDGGFQTGYNTAHIVKEHHRPFLV